MDGRSAVNRPQGGAGRLRPRPSDSAVQLGADARDAWKRPSQGNGHLPQEKPGKGGFMARDEWHKVREEEQDIAARQRFGCDNRADKQVGIEVYLTAARIAGDPTPSAARLCCLSDGYSSRTAAGYHRSVRTLSTRAPPSRFKDRNGA